MKANFGSWLTSYLADYKKPLIDLKLLKNGIIVKNNNTKTMKNKKLFPKIIL